MRTSELVSTLEDAWKFIQKLNADVPDVVILVGSGGRRAATLYGHFAKDSWTKPNEDKENTEKQEVLHEVLIVAEQLHRPAREIFTTLLHEAVHGIATSREIKDCSGNRHNKRFADLCIEVGLVPPEKPDSKIGWSAATLPEQTEALYGPQIEAIDKALQVVRLINFRKKETKKTTWIAACGCDRKIRLPKKTILDPDTLHIECNICEKPFELEPEEAAEFKG